ncbi:hypothetical protein [Bradyrhizobium iriomotense]|uniref:Uncharacterized protein n=1 Tax=Bradyrhizobium iriomotense TaxID=441950 RepID=A0ABQ6B5Y6_9BRAD|nr:hypothetical protein [Bradyrhizobium iriomotense]GLR89842.1 hypothetical protein GCM10007857_65560 [Bradyrhizobium iriomotense]
MQGVVVLLILLAMSYAAGYFTRDHISRKRHERARRWKGYMEPELPRPANANEIANHKGAVAAERGDLGQMLERWESRARARKFRASS